LYYVKHFLYISTSPSPRATLFPYTTLFRSVAVAAHRRWRASRQTGFVGPFVCSVERIDELRGVLGTDAESLDIALVCPADAYPEDRKSTRLNSSHVSISYAVFCLR